MLIAEKRKKEEGLKNTEEFLSPSDGE